MRLSNAGQRLGTSGSERVRAVVHDRYGPPDVLRLVDVARPVPKDDEVLVGIHATTVNRTDTGFRSAEFFVARFFTGLLRPRRKILGSEFAGEVEAVGAAVSQFEVGDRVFGVNAKGGAHTEFISIPESAPLAHMPTDMTFEEVAAVCDGALLALWVLKRTDLRKGREERRGAVTRCSTLSPRPLPKNRAFGAARSERLHFQQLSMA